MLRVDRSTVQVARMSKQRRNHRGGGMCFLWRLVAFVCLVVTSTSTTASAQDTDQADSSALSNLEILLRLYDEARGLRWDNHTNWLVTDDVCTWFGILCYTSDSTTDQRRVGHVQQIDLTGNHLVGTLPHEVFELPYIESIIVRNNADLDIPFTKIGEAQYLKKLIISSTAVKSLEGIQAATSLEEFHLTDLQLTGPFPPELLELTNLQGLYVNFNKFTGAIPTTIGGLTNLQQLYLYQNDLTGQIPTEIGKLSALRILAMASNAFGGTLPTELQLLTKLETLAIQRDEESPKGPGITGELPSFSDYTEITQLYLSHQKLSGSIPSDFLNSAPKGEAVQVALENNELSGGVPASLASLTRMSLMLQGNAISSIPEGFCTSIPDWFNGNVGSLGCNAFLCPPQTYASTGRETATEQCQACTSAQYYGSTNCGGATSETNGVAGSPREVLIDFYNVLGGKFWKTDQDWLDPAVSECSWFGIECNADNEITGIRLKNNGVIGTVPADVFTIATLQRLDLAGNSIDFKFSGIASAVNLEYLDLTHTDINSLVGIDGLASTKLRSLKLSSNDMNGMVPTEIFSISTLEELDLSHNKFAGWLPTEVGLLTNLRTLHWYGNTLSGYIPTEVGNLVNLVELALAENSFTGTLPTELDSMTMLETLALHQTNSLNSLRGPLLSFRDLVRLNVLELNSNHLTGAPPADLLKFTQRGSERVELKLGDNKLTGVVPGDWADRFDELVLDITGNFIDGIDDSLCQKDDWMEGSVTEFQCDAILCPKGTWNEFGRRTDSASPCKECTARTIDTLGAKICSEDDSNDEIAILKELYYATGGDRSWKNTTNWLTGDVACGWLGIACDASGNVEKIDLRNNGLKGTPTKSIFKLSYLSELYLANNEIDFSFEDIGLASKLRILHLSETNLDSLSGVGEAKELQELHATDNDLTGTLPNELFGLGNLKEVYLNFNRFTGRIPTDITRMSSLEKLYLFHNRLDGQIPAAIGSLLGLKDLVLSGNAFTGTLPNELNDLTNLEILAIEREGIALNSTEGEMEAGVRNGDFMLPGSGIHGPLPSFNKLTSLVSMTLGENALSGTIPYDFLDGIADKSAKIQVSLVANQLTGGIPAALTQFANLKIFLAGNKIDDMAEGLCLQADWLDGQVGTFGCDAILCPPDTASQYGRQYDTSSSCTACPDGTSAPYFGTYKCFDASEQQAQEEREILTSLFSATDGFTWQNRMNWVDDGASICTWYGITCVSDEVESVAGIHLQDNGLNGEIPTIIFQLKNLAEINFARDAVSFDFTGIDAATGLRYLDLDSTGLTSLGGLEAASSLSSLHINDNDFKGVFPSEILSLANLEVLHLTDNSWPSGLPAALASLGSLKYLSCYNCELSGPLPSWIAGMTTLEGIELHHNGFSGPLPAEIGGLTNLKKLDLSDQSLTPGGGFTGPLPDFAALSSLKYIYLSRNKFSGSIPSSFLNSTDNSGLVMLDLQYNELTGTVPSELARISQMNIFLANNKIEAIAPELCSLSWNGGAPAALGCDGILCDKGSFNILGRAREGTPCNICPSTNYTLYLGSTQCGPDLDMDILSILYIDLGGSDWTKSDGWMENNDVCTWYGITCGEEEGDSKGRVTGISLGENNLAGTVANEVFEIQYLNSLDLRSNNITLSFEGILNAQNLETLYLSQTKIKSLDGIKNAVSLKNLHLTDNYLNGPFPEEIFALELLEKLYLNFNTFTGSLSSEIASLRNLKDLYLFHNSLSGSIPSELALLPQIEVIALGENKFSGSLPNELSSIPTLKLLSLQREAGLSLTGEGLDGPLPAFENLPNIEQLYVGGNKFSGTIPSNFLSGVADKSKTVQVDLTHNKIDGSIPTSLADFDDLMLFLAGNRIDTVPDSICDKHTWMANEVGVNCDALLCPPGSFNQYGRRVNDDNLCQACTYQEAAQFYGSTTCEIENTDGLDERGILFQLYSATGGDGWTKRDNWDEDSSDVCSWYGVVCETVNGAETITQLELAANGLTGTFPAILFHLSSLKVLNLHNNSVEFSFHGIGYANSLSNLHIDETKTKSLDGIGEAKGLTVLHAQRNEFGGLNIPDELFSLTNLESLLLSSSGLEGPLSSRIGDLKKLKVLNLHENDFNGEIPSEIGLLGDLELLSLGENNFFGTLPTTLNQLSSIQSFSVDSFSRSNAGISGPLLSFSGLPKVRELYIGANSLTGTVPSDFLAGIDAPDETINVVLKANKLSGTLPGSLSSFSKLDIDITENKLEAIDASLCSINGWMDGLVAKYQCDAILCPSGEFNLAGRQISDEEPCQVCTGPDATTVLGSTSCASVQKVQERQVLQALFEATGGNDWKKKDGWMDSNVDICDWYGVSCRQNNTVESLLLGSNNLKGTPPPEVFQLPNLRFLWLYSNPIDFKFQGIERARKLVSLLLDSTGLQSLNGIGFAPALVDVDVRFNDLGGTLPNEIRNLHELQTFYVSNNRLTGSIPAFSTNRGLVELRLGNNQFAGNMPAFSTHRDITSLDVSDNQLTGTIPSTLLQSADPTNSMMIDLSSNQLTGTVPGELARFNDLTLYLRNNRLEGISPKLCGVASWNDGDVGEYQCDGILCPPDTYAPGIGRATQAGATCIPCDKAEFFGSSYCGNRPGSGSSMLKIGWVLVASLLTIPAYLVL